MPYDNDEQRLKGLVLNANDIPPEMLEEDSNTKYNRLLNQYEGMYKNYSSVPEKGLQQLEEARAERDRADNIARYADFGQELASAFNIAHGGQGFQATAGDKLRKRGQLGLDEAKQANKDIVAANLEKMKGAEGLLGMYQKNISDKEKRALDKEQKDINRSLLSIQQNQDRRAAEKSALELAGLRGDMTPQSPKSELMSSYIAKEKPEYAEDVKGKSYADIKPLIDLFEKTKPKFSEVKEREDAQIRKENRKLREGLSGAETSLKGQLSALKEAKKQFEKYSKNSTGGTGFLSTYGGAKKVFSKDLESLDSTFKRLQLDEMVKIFAGLSKAIDSDAERKAFESTQPSITLDDATNMMILERKIQAAEGLLKKTEAAKNRYDTRGNFTDEEPTQEVKRLGNDGKVHVFDLKSKKYLRTEDAPSN